MCPTPLHLLHRPSAILFAHSFAVNRGRFAESSMGPGAIPLEVDPGAGAVAADARGVVFGA